MTIDPAFAQTPTYGTLDHVVPRVKGGAKTSLANMVLACYACNLRKGTMSADAFRHLVIAQRGGNAHVV